MMSFGVPLMLCGLAGVAVPVLIHLLNRRRYDVVNWGAMQFLRIGQATRRRLFMENLLLLLLRMGLIALLVMALAAPYLDSPSLARLGGEANRDVVLLFDGSYSMGYHGTGNTAHDKAKEWAISFFDALAANDGVAVLQAREHVQAVLGELSHDRERVRKAIAELPLPRGGCDWPQAVRQAYQILAQSQRPKRDIIILGDGQRYGWADEATLLRWELLAQVRDRGDSPPRIWVVNLDPERPADPPNWSLAPLRASRVVASVGQQLIFRTALELHGSEEYKPPYRLRLEVDGRPAADLDTPQSARLEKGQVPIEFGQRFTIPGSHLVSVILEVDPPLNKRPPGYQVRDHLPGDNRQDLAIEVLPALPVLLVDGDARPAPGDRGTDFLRDALAPAKDRAPVVLARVVSIRDFEPKLLASDLTKQADIKPRVLVLANVPRLTTQQQEAVAQFLASGGGVLITLGRRIDAFSYNEQLYRDGQGWLPARLEEIGGNIAKPDQAASPFGPSFFHPALELFRAAASGGLADARFPRWWKVTIPAHQSAVKVASLTNDDPFLVEKAYQGGRSLLCTVPLDNSWGTNLMDLPAFAPLAHELIFYLAGARAVEHNFQPGQPIHCRMKPEEPLTGLWLQPPDEVKKPLAVEPTLDSGVYGADLVRQAQGPLLVYEHTQEAGVYRLSTASGRTAYYVAQPDHRESDLASCADADRQKVSKLMPMTYENDRERVLAGQSGLGQRQELWWCLLLGVMALLLGEVWLTRRMAKGR